MRMNKALSLLMFISLICLSPEAYVSEFHEYSNETIQDKIKNSDHIVIVAPTEPKFVVLKEVRFPKETHFKKKKESIYVEKNEIFQVIEVLKSDKIKPGDIQVWKAPEYNEQAVKAEHERDEVEGIVVKSYKPKFSPDKSKPRVLFLKNGWEENKSLVFNDFEGISAKEEIVKKLNSKP